MRTLQLRLPSHILPTHHRRLGGTHPRRRRRRRHEVGAHFRGRGGDGVERGLPFPEVVFRVVEDLAGLGGVFEGGADVAGDDCWGIRELGDYGSVKGGGEKEEEGVGRTGCVI